MNRKQDKVIWAILRQIGFPDKYDFLKKDRIYYGNQELIKPSL